MCWSGCFQSGLFQGQSVIPQKAAEACNILRLLRFQGGGPGCFRPGGAEGTGGAPGSNSRRTRLRLSHGDFHDMYLITVSLSCLVKCLEKFTFYFERFKRLLVSGLNSVQQTLEGVGFENPGAHRQKSRCFRGKMQVGPGGGCRAVQARQEGLNGPRLKSRKDV